jgi:chemotaxis signal transduction protein
VSTAESPTPHVPGTPVALWCYLATVGEQLLALPDDERTRLLPYISALPPVTALPSILVPPYVLGLVNIAQRGEVLVDLARLLGLREAPLPPDQTAAQRMVVYGEELAPPPRGHRLAFAVDAGHELAEGRSQPEHARHPLGNVVRQVLATPRGDAVLLDMEMICKRVLRDLGATRLWNEPEPQAGEGLKPAG